MSSYHLYRTVIFFLLSALGLMVIGMAIGALAVKFLPAESLLSLENQLDNSLQTLGTNINYSGLMDYALVRNLLTISFLWFLGLTLIGIPLILLYLIYRGFVIGFTVALLLQARPSDGLLLILLGVLPSNVLFLPSLALSGAIALGFSYWLFIERRKSAASSPGIGKMLLFYCIGTLVSMFAASLAGMIDAYLSPWLLTLFYT